MIVKRFNRAMKEKKRESVSVFLKLRFCFLKTAAREFLKPGIIF